ncbi:MAG: NAD-dependent epimerase/dehydratase family protein [Sphingobacteriaceae bacterium]|nr:MAG: NAD-dependent epimerase/dehydratase family protein [Sphingobacteriaceae bacterium]
MANRIIQEDIDQVFNSGLPWDKFRNKTVLISGASGFVASYMVETLLSVNDRLNQSTKIIALVRNPEKAHKRFKDYLRREDLKFIVQDVAEPFNINEKIDYIIHAASQASPKYYGVDPVGTLSANVTGTLNLLELARKNHIRSFLYFSSSEVYGRVEDDHNPVKEYFYGYLDPMRVRSCYGESKRMGENICVSYYHQYGIKAKVVRPFHTYGPGMDLQDGRVYADFVADVIAGKDIEMKSDGIARRAFCYLKDATIGFFTVLLKGRDGEAYNVGNPVEEHRIIDLAEIIATLGDKPLHVIKVPVADNNAYLKSPLIRNTPDISKIAALGWSPDTSVEAGFKRTIESYAFMDVSG